MLQQIFRLISSNYGNNTGGCERGRRTKLPTGAISRDTARFERKRFHDGFPMGQLLVLQQWYGRTSPRESALHNFQRIQREVQRWYDLDAPKSVIVPSLWGRLSDE